ncbi:hypothetical protein Tco_1146563 [Tanacetum coccineum]
MYLRLTTVDGLDGTERGYQGRGCYTLTRLRSSLDDITKNVQMEYLPKRRWNSLEKKRAHIMIKAIDKQLKERRMMMSLEKYVDGRYHKTDLRLLQRTI